MKNKQVIAIFVIGVAMLLLAFWAGLQVVRENSAANTSQVGGTPGAAAPESDDADNETRYIVQIGASFGTEAKADELTAELRSKYRSAHTQKPEGGETLYRVNIGPYKTRDEARQVARQLAADGHKGVMILPWNQK